MKTYTILSGSFLMSDGSVRHAGETIELADDVAAMHAHNLQPVQTSADDAGAADHHEA